MNFEAWSEEQGAWGSGAAGSSKATVVSWQGEERGDAVTCDETLRDEKTGRE
jgi:hypothetical protein